MGLVGDSGCGKTTVGRTILRLHEVTDGQVIFDGRIWQRFLPENLENASTVTDDFSGSIFEHVSTSSYWRDHWRGSKGTQYCT